MRFPDKPIIGAQDFAYHRPVGISVPAESFDITYCAPAGIYDVETMSYWMELPLLTAERALFLAFPRETRDYFIDAQRILSASRMPDADVYREFYYRKFRCIDTNDVRDPVCKMVIAQLVPWALTNKDLEEFMKVSKVCLCSGISACHVVDCLHMQFPAFSMDQIVPPRDGSETTSPGPTYGRVHKIWAKVRKRISLHGIYTLNMC
jgi:hypothetical protein